MRHDALQGVRQLRPYLMLLVGREDVEHAARQGYACKKCYSLPHRSRWMIRALDRRENFSGASAQ